MTRFLPFYRYKKHLGLDVNVKNARVRARAEMVCRYNVIPLVCGDGNCNDIPEMYPILSTKSRGDREMTEVIKYIGERRG